MSATEAQIRYEQMQRLLGPTLGRLQNDLLIPIISRAFKLLAREGQLPDPPQEVIDANAEFDIEFVGPLARAQKTDRATSTERFVAFGANLAQVNPAALDNIDFDDAIRSVGRDLAVPPSAIRDAKEVEKVRTERNERERAMADAEIQKMQGEAGQANAVAERERNANQQA